MLQNMASKRSLSSSMSYSQPVTAAISCVRRRRRSTSSRLSAKSPLANERPDALADERERGDVIGVVRFVLVADADQEPHFALVDDRHAEMALQRGVALRQATLLHLRGVVVVHARERARAPNRPRSRPSRPGSGDRRPPCNSPGCRATRRRVRSCLDPRSGSAGSRCGSTSPPARDRCLPGSAPAPAIPPPRVRVAESCAVRSP